MGGPGVSRGAGVLCVVCRCPAALQGPGHIVSCPWLAGDPGHPLQDAAGTLSQGPVTRHPRLPQDGASSWALHTHRSDGRAPGRRPLRGQVPTHCCQNWVRASKGLPHFLHTVGLHKWPVSPSGQGLGCTWHVPWRNAHSAHLLQVRPPMGRGPGEAAHQLPARVQRYLRKETKQPLAVTAELRDHLPGAEQQ